VKDSAKWVSGILPGIGYDEGKVIGSQPRIRRGCNDPAGKVAWGGFCVMLVANLVLLGLLGQVPGGQADPSSLAAQLGSGRYAEREAASDALERLGRSALPALRAARDSRIWRSAIVLTI